jgi:hypothetical protein
MTCISQSIVKRVSRAIVSWIIWCDDARPQTPHTTHADPNAVEHANAISYFQDYIDLITYVECLDDISSDGDTAPSLVASERYACKEASLLHSTINQESDMLVLVS